MYQREYHNDSLEAVIEAERFRRSPYHPVNWTMSSLDKRVCSASIF